MSTPDLDYEAFSALKIPQVSYHNYMVDCGGDIEAARALSERRLEALRSMVVASRCDRCQRGPVYASDHARGYMGIGHYHRDCRAEQEAEQEQEAATTPYRLWPFHAHGSDWGGGNGTMAARTADEARAKVLAWAERQAGSISPEAVGGSDELGLFVTIGEPEAPLGPDEIAAALDVKRQTVDNWRQRPATGFPAPDLVVSGRPLWWRPTIEEWALARPRRGRPKEEDAS